MNRAFSWGMVVQSGVVNPELSQKGVHSGVDLIWSTKGGQCLHDLEGGND